MVRPALSDSALSAPEDARGSGNVFENARPRASLPEMATQTMGSEKKVLSESVPRALRVFLFSDRIGNEMGVVASDAGVGTVRSVFGRPRTVKQYRRFLVGYHLARAAGTSRKCSAAPLARRNTLSLSSGA